jgi:hypothetical protein
MRQVLAVQQHDPRPRARRAKLAALALAAQQTFELAVGVARAEQNKLPPEVPAGVHQRPPDQVDALLRDQAGDADHQRGRRVDVEAQAALHKLLADPFPFPEASGVVVHGQARVGGRVPQVLVDAVELEKEGEREKEREEKRVGLKSELKERRKKNLSLFSLFSPAALSLNQLRTTPENLAATSGLASVPRSQPAAPPRRASAA